MVELNSGGSDTTSLALPSAQLPGAAVLEAWPGLVPGPQSLHLGWMLQGRVQAGLHFLALSGAVLWLKAECHLALGESQGEGRQREVHTDSVMINFPGFWSPGGLSFCIFQEMLQELRREHLWRELSCAHPSQGGQVQGIDPSTQV